MKNQILIAVDLSESSELVIKKGIELAIKMEASVILSSVVPMYVDYLQSQMSMVPTPWDEIYTAQKEAAIKELKLVQDKFPNIPIEIYVEVGNAKDVVIEKAKKEKVDYIVVGTHGRTGFSHVVMGSTAEYIVRHSTMPVMVVPMK
jgi:nucleotide-binding universal stress UspA family protein